ncbi:MAG: choice-of-anchor L domain-containing protein [Ilumatobacteraceae bacterium]
MKIAPFVAGSVVAGYIALLAGPAPSASAASWTIRSIADGVTPTQLAQSLAGSGVVVSNVTYSGDSASAGTFSVPSGEIGLTSGVILSTGDASDAPGPNDSPSTYEPDPFTGSVGDSTLDGLIASTGNLTTDATVLQFSVVPTSSQLNISYVFASEEYDEYVGSPFDDVFGFFVNGVNCAVVPGNNARVSVNSVNSGQEYSGIVFEPATNPLFHVRNLDTTGSGQGPYDTQYDGFTIPLTCRAAVTPGQLTTVKLAISDVSDTILDSAVFLQAEGITSSAAGPCKGVSPGRLVDTRNGVGLPKTRIEAGQTVTVKVRGEKNVPNNALAAILNVTVDRTTGSGFLTVYPSGGSLPETSSVNFSGPNGTASNSVITNIGSDGQIKIFAEVATDVIVDVFGYCGPTGTDRLVQMTPVRVADTRTGIGVAQNKISAGGVLEVNLANSQTPTSYGMAVLNITAVDGGGWGYLSVWPANESMPDSSNVNYSGSTPTPNTVIVPVSPDGKIKIYSLQSAHVVVDMMGWLGSTGIQEFNVITPKRLYDSRKASFNPTGAKLTSSGLTLQIAGANGVPSIARTVVLNVTVVNPAADGYVTVWPSDKSQPNTSNVNYLAGQIVPNSVVVGLSATGKVSLSSYASTDVIVDIVGWYF